MNEKGLFRGQNYSCVSSSAVLPCFAVPGLRTGYPGSGGGSGFPLTITDDLGRQVTVSREPVRIVSWPHPNRGPLCPWSGDRVVGVTEFCTTPKPRRSRGEGFHPNPELVVAAQPDLVLAGVIQKDFIHQFEEAGLTVALESPDRPAPWKGYGWWGA